MYLICYMDRSNISVAQPEIAKAFGLSKSAMGLDSGGVHLGLCAGAGPGRLAGRPVRSEESPDVIMIWWSAAAVMTGAAVGIASLFTRAFLSGLGEAGAFPVASRGMQLWFARSERGRIQGTTHFFSRFAVAITPLVAGSIMLQRSAGAPFSIFSDRSGVHLGGRFQHCCIATTRKTSRRKSALNWPSNSRH